MQYVVKERSPDITSSRKTWEVLATDAEGGYLGRICRFNTEQQARDYAKVQEGIDVQTWRDKAHKENFLVAINGELRAMFVRRTYSTGYLFKAADGADISSEVYRGGSRITQADFELVVRSAIAAGTVPTLAQLKRSQLIREAEAEDRQRNKERSEHAAQVRRHVLLSALGLYLQTGPIDAEHKAKAEQMLDGLKSGSGWL